MIAESEIQRRRLPLRERGIELALVDWGGDGPLALLAHANGFCADVLGVLAERLRERFHVIGFDARGHGDSEKPAPPEPYGWNEFGLDLSALAAALVAERGEETIALGVGHSFGGTCLMNASAREPQRFARLALLDPVIVPPPADFPNADPMARGPNVAADIARKRTTSSPRARSSASAGARRERLRTGIRARSSCTSRTASAIGPTGRSSSSAPGRSRPPSTSRAAASTPGRMPRGSRDRCSTCTPARATSRAPSPSDSPRARARSSCAPWTPRT